RHHESGCPAAHRGDGLTSAHSRSRAEIMIRVHVLTEDRGQSSIAFNQPLRLNRRLLRDAGLDVRLFLDGANPALFDGDVLFINDNVFGSCWPGLRGPVEELLEQGRRRTGRIVWFDTSDSSGTT